MAKPKSVLTLLQKNLPRGMQFDPMVWEYLTWLETDWGVQRFRSSGDPFLPALPVNDLKRMESHLAVHPMPQVVDRWFTPPRKPRTKLGKVLRFTGVTHAKRQPIYPFIRSSASGSVIAMWQQPDEPLRYVLMGSEGEAYTLAEHPLAFLAILALGYEEIDARSFLEFRPGLMLDHPAVVAARGWLVDRFDIKFPVTAAAALPYSSDNDPFTRHVMRANGVYIEFEEVALQPDPPSELQGPDDQDHGDGNTDHDHL